MAAERVIIQITGDTTSINSTISELEKLGKVDIKNKRIFDENNRRFNENLNKTKDNLGVFGDQLNSLKQQVIGAFAVSSLIAFGKEAVATAAKIEGIGNSLKFITGSSANAEKTMTYLRELSNRLGLEFESTAQAFKLFAGATTQAGMTLGQTKSIFESVSKAVTTMGLSADDANGVFLALSQIMSKGKVSAEELRSQIGERIPGAFTIAAKSIGVTEQQLNKMLEQGQIISKDFLPKFAKQLEKDLGGGAENAANSTQAALNRLKNSFDEFLLYAGQKLAPGVKLLSKVFEGLTYAMRGEAGQREASARQQGVEYAKEIIKDLEKVEDLNLRSDESLDKRNFYYKRLYQTQEEINKLLAERERVLKTPRKTGTAISGMLNDINIEIEALAGNKYMYEEIINSLKEYDDTLSSQNNTLNQNTDETNKNSKSKEKELNAYEDLIKSARDLEEAMKVTLAEKKIISPEAIKQLDDFKFQIDYIERTLKNISNPDLKNINVGSSADKVPIKMLEETPLPPGDYGKAATDAETAALLALQDEYWKDQEAYEKAQKEKTRIAQEEAEKRKAQSVENNRILLEATLGAMQTSVDGIFSSIAASDEMAMESQLSNLERLKNERIISDKEYEKRKKELLNENAEQQQEMAIFQATINTALAIVNALATGGPAAVALAIAAGIAGAAQIAAIAAQPVPQFAKGTDYVALGNNKKGVDTIPALLNEGEAVITSEQNALYPGMAKAWNDGKLDEHIYKKWVLPELIMNKSFEQQRQKSFAENVANSIHLNQDFGDLSNKLKRIEQAEKEGAIYIGNKIERAISKNYRSGY